MFARKKKNKSGSTTIQAIRKHNGKNKVVKSFGTSYDKVEVERLYYKAKHYVKTFNNQLDLFSQQKSLEHSIIEDFINNLKNSQIRTVGPELIFGKIYDKIGYNIINKQLLRHVVIARLAFPLSKLKTSEYIYRYQRINISVDKIYRFLDELNNKYKEKIELINFKYITDIINEDVNFVFYDMTSLHFEASDEDDLRKTGFSKNGKHRNPQILLGLLVTKEGYPIGYDIFEGNIFEAHTLIPFISNITKKFNLKQPTIVADAGLLTNKNIEELEKKSYSFILGGRLKSEKESIKSSILEKKKEYQKKEYYNFIISKQGNKRLIVEYSDVRARKDKQNRERGLKRLEKDLKRGRLTKSHINNRGYNKYLKMKGSVDIELDYAKFEKDSEWDGLKGYVTNSNISNEELLSKYKNLWVIEKAFRMSKTDLKIRPIYHRLKSRIESHICISFMSYTIMKELERVLKKEKSEISLKRGMESTQNMYELQVTLPDSIEEENILLKMDNIQKEVYEITKKYFG